MVRYLVNQIVIGKLSYLQVVSARPDMQEEIDNYIAEKQLYIDKTK